MTDESERQFRALSGRNRRILEAAIVSRLEHQPTTVSKAVKRMRTNPLAEFELRTGDLRVLYNVEGDEVVILIVGQKVGNQLVVEGEKYHGHQEYPTQPLGHGTESDAS